MGVSLIQIERTHGIQAKALDEHKVEEIGSLTRLAHSDRRNL